MINRDRLLDTFLDYVRIDSESTHEGAIAARVAEDLQAIGCQVDLDDTQAQTGSDTGNLYCTLPGTAPGQPILLSAHLDTVIPGTGVEPVLENGVIRSKGDTVLGSDDKAGVAAIVEALRSLVEQRLPHPPVQAVFTVCEEIGLRGSRHLDDSRILAKQAVVLDSDGDAGRIITSAPGQYQITARITGRRTHAGVAPEEGISAIQVAAEAISQMRLLRVDQETTANIGSISSQYATNIVPEVLDLAAEARSLDTDKLERQAEHMAQCLRHACEKYGAALDLQMSKAYSPFSIPSEDSFLRAVMAACERVGLTPSLSATGGGSDANNMNAHGIKALVLGVGMSKVHTTQEEISVQNLVDTASLVLSLITDKAP